MTIINLAVAKLLGDAERAVQQLRDANIYGLADAAVTYKADDHVVIWITLEPWAVPAAQGYPTELVAITIWGDGRIQTVAAHGNRPFLHRYPPQFPGDLIQPLCLWYPNDPRALRWSWSDGLAAYVTIVHRHLQAEECWRRRGVWPGEDAPHGYGDHPIRTPALQRLVTQRGPG